MAHNTKQIYTATPEDNKIIKEWIDTCSSEDSELKLDILDFYLKWILDHNRKTDSIYQ